MHRFMHNGLSIFFGKSRVRNGFEYYCIRYMPNINLALI